jgi:hypothetical protein
MQNYSDEELRKILKYPHLLGHLAGKDRLKKFHSDWINYVWYPYEHRSLAAHRGSYKTTAITEIGSIIKLAKEPDARIAIVKKTFTNAAESVRNIANIMMLPDVYAFLEDMWGPWKFTTLKDGKFNLSVKQTKTQQGSMEALGADSRFTGKHFDFIMIDDLIDLDDRLSEAEREHTNTVINELFSNVIDPGKHIGATGTFWHKKDGWSILPTPKIYTINDTNLFTVEQIEEKRRFTTPMLWSINYFLTHESEQDQPFLNPNLGMWHDDKVTDVKAHVDAAYDGSHYCALTILGRLPGGKFNGTGFVFPGNIKNWIPFVVKKMVEYKANRVYIETNSDRGYTGDYIRMHPEAKRNHIWVEDYDERMKKTEKINTFAYEIWKDIEWDNQGMDKNYLEQIVDYLPDQEPDDAPDSLSSLIKEGKYSITKTFDTNIWGD